MLTSRVTYKFAPLAMILLMAFGYSTVEISGHQKKVNKELAVLWPEAGATMLAYSLSEKQKSLAASIGIEELYVLFAEHDTLGYFAFVVVPSKLDKFDIGVFYNTDGEILSMKVLAYREDHGGEVGSKRWLKQFIGLDDRAPMKLNDDIQGISGATISCEAATKGARDATVFINELIQDPLK